MLAFFVSAGYPVNPPNKGINSPKAVASVSTATATSTTKFTSVLGGNVTADGGATVTERGVCWGTSVNPTIDKLSNRLANGSGTGSFSATIAPLLPGIQYHVRAYAINSAGVAYGANVTFTTSAASANRGWYFSSSTGNDNTGNGTISAPYQTLVKLQNLITVNNVTFQPGDSVLFKKGDVFANGYNGTSGFEYVSCSWINDPRYGYTSPSGTAAKPIIITSYGTGAKPNFYFPTASFPIRGNSQIQHNIFEFAGVEYITIDGLNFIDTRWAATNHSDPAYTRSCFIFGEWPNGYNADSNVRRYATNHCEVKNCRFQNVSFAFGSVGGSYNKFTYDTMINMMACTDTFGTHDIGAGAFDGMNGNYNDFSHNYIESSWGKSGRNSSGQGMLGVAFDIFDLKYSRISYNTIIDVRHAMEIGNLDTGDSTSGAQYDTFAFNKCIGMYQFGYLHGGAGDPFTGNVHNISIWNNVLIENNSSRMSGPNFGYDRKGDGTTFNQFWFFGNKNLTNGYNAGYGNFTSGSNIVTGMTETGGMVAGNQSTGSQVAGYDNNPYLPESPMAWITAKTGTSTNATLTLSQPATATATQQEIIFFPPWNMKGITWSMPPNVSSSGYYNSWDNSNASNRLTVQYSSDNTIWGRGFDTLIDLRNNIFYNTTGMQMIPSGFNRFKHRNNAYYVKGGFSYTGGAGVYTNLTRMGGALGTNEVSTTAKLFVDTTAALPENWNLSPLVGSAVSNTGIPIPVFTTDFAGNPLTNPPSMGLYNSTPAVVGRHFYVSSSYTGSTSNGALATPWKTLVQVEAFGPSALPGDTISFKKGDVFANGSSGYNSMMWWGPSRSGSCASGTALNPILFNSYGTGAKPNMLYPYPTAQAANNKLVLGFSGVEYITVDGLQFIDTRFSVTDKVGTALTKTGIMLGEGTSGIGYCNNCIVKNCDFSNIGSAIEAAGNYQIIDSNTITNLKSWGDTSGQNDAGAMPIARSNGKHCRITHNYIKGGWCFTGATASGEGLNGVGIEVLNDFDSSFVGYNTIIDCAGGFEIGSQIGPSSGPDNDTFAYNKFINLGSLAYAATNTGGAFGGTIRKLRFWNNVYVQNQWSRLAGPRFGADTYSDGQSFAQFPSWGNGSGIPPGSYPYNSSRILGNYNIWAVLAYNYDNGVSTDTVYDSRNNVFWMTAGLPILKTNASTINLKRRNNIYHVAGSDSYPSILGPSGTTTSIGEFSTTAKLFNDSTSNFPENWNMQLFSGSPAVDAGTVTGVSPDFAGVPVVGVPEIGIYQFAPPVATVPVITTTTPYNITSTSVWSGGTVTSAGASAVISRAVIISKNPIVDTVSRVGGAKYNDYNLSVASFAFPLDGVPLDTNTLYHVRAFAVNSSGIGWGSDLTFTTLAPQPPVITSITPTSGGYGTSVLIRGRNFLGMSSVELVTAVRALVLVNSITDTTITVTVNLSSSQYVNAPSGGMFIITTSQGVNTTSPLFIYTPPATPCSFTYSGWGSCNSGRQARSYTTSPAGCTGTPPADSLSRACITPVVSSFSYYQQYNSIYLVTNIAGTVQFQNSLGVIVSTIPYDSGASWISVAFLTPSGTYTGITYGRSLTFNNGFYMSVTSTTRPACSNTYDGVINMTCGNGTGPYLWSINSTTNYSKTGTSVSWTGLRRGTYTFRVKEANNVIHTLTYKLAKVAGSTCFKLTLINESYAKL